MRSWDYKAFRTGRPGGPSMADYTIGWDAPDLLPFMPFHSGFLYILLLPLLPLLDPQPVPSGTCFSPHTKPLSARKLHWLVRFTMGGGGTSNRIDWGSLQKYVRNARNMNYGNDVKFTVAGYGDEETMLKLAKTDDFVVADMPFVNTLWHMTKAQLEDAIRLHHIDEGELRLQRNLGEKRLFLSQHECDDQCSSKKNVVVLKRVLSTTERKKEERKKKKAATNPPSVDASDAPSSFPPEPVTDALMEEIVHGFCEDTGKEKLEETGCACCGILCNKSMSMSASDKKLDLSLLIEPHATRKERSDEREPIQ